MTNTEAITVHPVNLRLIDQSELGQEVAGYFFILNAQMGRISEPVESITEGDMLNPDYMHEADLIAWQEEMEEYQREAMEERASIEAEMTWRWNER
jgi:hypothetical protein